MSWTLSPNRCFSAEPTQRRIARTLYESVRNLPLVCPHGHVPPKLLADPTARFGSPSELFIIPDHYVLRMLYSQGVPLEALGVPTVDGTPTEQDHRAIWQTFADHFHLFRGTPSGLWLSAELTELFHVPSKLHNENAQDVYDHIASKLAEPDYTPRALFQRFHIEVLCTTDAATDNLEHHRALQKEGWGTRVRPTFRPDDVINITTPHWHQHIQRLSEVSGIDVTNYKAFIAALEKQREFFKSMGATATDHGVLSADTSPLSLHEAQRIFDAALRGNISNDSAARFSAHMLYEMARMSAEDGLVMQLHIGSWRNHNEALYRRFGPDKGADIPIGIEWTRSLHPLLNAFGTHPNFRVILFTLDESTYSRELAPLAGHYPSVYIGPPWWFFDSVHGMERFLNRVMETAGLYNTAGFNDDTRAFTSIPARHDVWRRVTCNWLAKQVTLGLIDEEDATEMAREFAYGLAKMAYNLP